MRYKKHLAISIVTLIISSCIPKVYKGDFFAKPGKTQKETTLKISGSYYNIENKTKSLNVLFFYDNYIHRSMMFDINHYDSNKVSQSINNSIREFKALNKKVHEYQYFEDGGYLLNNSELTIQRIRYIPQFNWGTVTYKGEIINDTTILITQYTHHIRKIYKIDSLYYHFISTEKPDSLKGNRWKNKKWYWFNSK